MKNADKKNGMLLKKMFIPFPEIVTNWRYIFTELREPIY
jgi:hypothetical protein